MNTIHDTGFGDTDLERGAKAIFDAKIAPTLTQSDIGKYLVIDTETGDYVIDTDQYQASRRAYDRRPGARTRFGVRIGFRTAISACALQ